MYLILNLRKEWRNRNRILVRDIQIKEQLIVIRLENLGDEPNSIKNVIKIKGIAATTPKHDILKMSININPDSEVHLLPNKPVDISASLSTVQEGELFFLWYFSINVDSTKNCSVHIRFKNIHERYDGNTISFMFKKYFYRFFSESLK